MIRLFKGITVVLTVIGATVIIWLEVDLLRYCFVPTNPPASGGIWSVWLQAANYAEMIKNTKLLLIANTVEIALVWLLVLLDIISRRRGLIANAVLFILAGITIFIVIRFIPSF